MKLLWVSNAPWAPSGYGSQTRQVGRRIARAGYDVEFVANDGVRGDVEWEGHHVRASSGNDRYSRDSIREDFRRSEADWLVFLYDAWVFTEGGRDPFEGVPRVAGWVPVDHYPTPLSLYPWLGGGHLPIAMSRYGFDRLTELSAAFKKNGRKPFPVRYAPHAVDDVFRPVKANFRDAIDVPKDAYLVGIVAANNGTMVYDRKGFGDMIAAMARFMEQRPDAYLYMHTLQKTFDGMDLPQLCAFKGIDGSRLRWADQYMLTKRQISDEQMAGIYSSLSILLATSRGEGFGLPVLEAQACGSPVIASNWTAQAELVGEPWSQTDMGNQRHPSGWLVGVDPDYDPRQGADFAKPRIGNIIAALNDAYESRNDPALREAAIAKASNWKADAVFETHWKPILGEMEDTLRSAKVRNLIAPKPALIVPRNRAERRMAAAR